MNRYLLSFAALLLVAAGCGKDTETIYKTETVTPECSPSAPSGVCPAGKTCAYGACVDIAGLCSPNNLGGSCPSGMTCFAGGCVLASDLCGDANPTGPCPTAHTCLEGACVATASLCSEANPSGVCPAGRTCQEGMCAVPGYDPCTEPVYTTQPTIVARTDYAAKATGTAAPVGVAAGDKFTLGDVTFTAVASNPGANEFAVGASDEATAANLAAAVNASQGTEGLVSASATGNVITFTATASGAKGNGIGMNAAPESKFTFSANKVLAGGKGTGKAVLTIGTMQFKDLSGNGQLDMYEDWRLRELCRAKDLVSKMTLSQKIGLMSESSSMGSGNAEAMMPAQQRDRIMNQNVRQALFRFGSNSGPMLAAYSNSLQEFAEAQELGVPLVFTGDPTHGIQMQTNPTTGAQTNSTGIFSRWPLPAGLGAARDVALTRQYGDTVRKEFMAAGLRWQLGPMGDTATEPRWDRMQNTFGEGLGAMAHTRACVVGFQGSENGDLRNGIAATVKHFPGAGANQDGMDSHSYPGRYNVYPGDNFEYHLLSFQAAFDVGAAAIMPCYSVFKDQFQWDPMQVPAGNSYGMITRLAKERMGFKGMVTGDWGNIGHNYGAVSSLSNAERAALWLHAGSHQFGSDAASNFKDAFDQGLVTTADIDGAAIKILEMSFKLGIFENPYVDADPAHVEAIVRGEETMTAGFNAQKRAIVMLRNQGNRLPISGSRAECDANEDGVVKVYFDGEKDALAGADEMSRFLGDYDYASAAAGTVRAVAHTANLAEADLAVLRVVARAGVYFGADAGFPLSFDGAFKGTGDDGQVARSIKDRNRVIDAFRVRDGYTKADGTVVPAANPKLKIVLVMHAWRPGIVKPFIHGLKTLDELAGVPDSYPTVSDEANVNPKIVTASTATEKAGVDAFLVEFGAFDRAVLDFLFNKAVPPGVDRHGLARLPFELPSSDAEVEAQLEDLPADTRTPTYTIGSGSNLPVP